MDTASEDVTVRLFAAKDRQAVWDIACDTADKGRPIEDFFPDRKVAGEMIMRYYTDFEPGSLWVAECENKVVGYLSGCLNSSRYSRMMALRILPPAIFKAVLRGLLWHRQARMMFKAAWRSFLKSGLRADMPLKDYPAHLHINFLEAYRGRHIGVRLMESFLKQAREAGVGGIHASVLEDNKIASKFFENAGFNVVRRYPVFLPNDNASSLHHTRIYGIKL